MEKLSARGVDVVAVTQAELLKAVHRANQSHESWM